MRIGYGYKRSDKDFAGANVGKVFIDHPGTERMERGAMLDAGGVRKGDTLVLLARGDLGRGGEIANLRMFLEQIGVNVEISEASAPVAKAPVGHPGKLHLPDAEAEMARKLWHGLQWSGPYVLKRIREISGFKGDDRALRNALNYRFGTRTKPKQ